MIPLIIFVFGEFSSPVDISIFLWLHKQRPKFANGQPRGYFQITDLDRTTEAIARMNVDSKVENAEVNVPKCASMFASD